MTTNKIISALKGYLAGQIEGIASSNPLIAFTKPIIIRVIDNKIESLASFLDLLKDSNGDINLADIITEMTTSVMDSKTFPINVPILGTITIGGGYIKIPIPYTEQVIVLNSQDIEELKTVLTNNNE